MAETILLEIVTPQGQAASLEVEEVTAPGSEGEFGVLPGHAHFLTLLKTGGVTYRKGNEAGHFAVGKGYGEVGADKTTLLVSEAFDGQELDLDDCRDELTEAKSALEALTEEDPAYWDALEKFELSEVKVSVAEKSGG